MGMIYDSVPVLWMDDADDIEEDPGSLRRLNVLYLVSELEAAIGRGGVTWAAEDAEGIPQRLANVSSALRRQASHYASSVTSPHFTRHDVTWLRATRQTTYGMLPKTVLIPKSRARLRRS
jgi:hypothetical protein